MILKPNRHNAKRATTKRGLHKVFAYGSLRSWSRPVVEVRGMLCLRPTGQAAVDFGEPELWTRGEILTVDDQGLWELDLREGALARFPWYERILVKTRDGQICWAYQWARGFRGFQILHGGEWSFSFLRIHVARYGSRNKIAATYPEKTRGKPGCSNTNYDHV